MGVDQPKVSALLNGRLANFSSERLMRLLTALGQDVDIMVRSKPRNRAHGRIRVLGDANPYTIRKNSVPPSRVPLPSRFGERRRTAADFLVQNWSAVLQTT